ncbi:hypothetical protein M9Y10_041237 [Tritrichomonas musculus]|uniref:Actin n=1 Tax=Tritrichomonas musculus TaxID=1915356 RepID=A0ABR2K4P0_9EUKA
MAEESQTIVIDNGSHMMKAGYGGDEAPRSVFRSIIGRSKYVSIVGAPLNRNLFIGDDAWDKAEILNINYPIKHGVVTNWDDMEKIWSFTFQKELRVDPTQHPVVVIEPVKNPKSNREKMAQIMFETFNVPSFYVSIQSIVSIYSFGRDTGIVCNIGDGVSEFYPICKGFSLSHAVIRNDFAGDDVNNWLQELLREHGHNFTTTEEKKIVRDIKEKHSYAALDYESELQKAKNTTDCEVQYTLPNGQSIVISDERFRCSELLFKPNMNGFELDGIHKCIFNSIMKCDIGARKHLYSSILLCGGSSMINGLPERIYKEITNLAPPTNPIKILAPPERKNSAWIGGSILASLTQFQPMLISHDQYNANGVGIVHNKCFY